MDLCAARQQIIHYVNTRAINVPSFTLRTVTLKFRVSNLQDRQVGMKQKAEPMTAHLMFWEKLLLAITCTAIGKVGDGSQKKCRKRVRALRPRYRAQAQKFPEMFRGSKSIDICMLSCEVILGIELGRSAGIRMGLQFLVNPWNYLVVPREFPSFRKLVLLH
jgi:hypothetical protein